MAAFAAPHRAARTLSPAGAEVRPGRKTKGVEVEGGERAAGGAAGRRAGGGGAPARRAGGRSPGAAAAAARARGARAEAAAGIGGRAKSDARGAVEPLCANPTPVSSLSKPGPGRRPRPPCSSAPGPRPPPADTARGPCPARRPTFAPPHTRARPKRTSPRCGRGTSAPVRMSDEARGVRGGRGRLGARAYAVPSFPAALFHHFKDPVMITDGARHRGGVGAPRQGGAGAGRAPRDGMGAHRPPSFARPHAVPVR